MKQIDTGLVSGRRSTGRRWSGRRWSGRLALWLPISVIVASLLALLAVPAILQPRTMAAVAVIADVLAPATSRLEEVQVALVRQLGLVRGYAIAPNPSLIERYRLRLADEAAARAELVRLIDQVPISPIPERYAVFDSTLQAWHARPVEAEMLAGSVTAENYADRFFEDQSRFDELLAAFAGISAAFAQVEDTLRDRVVRNEELRRTANVVLSLLALLATLAVAWLGLRVRRLAFIAEQRGIALERVLEGKTRLMRGLSHDLKNPLSAIQGYAELLEQGLLDGLRPRQREAVSRIQGAVSASTALIDDLLDLARAETGDLPLKEQPTDVVRVVREITDEHSAEAAAAGLRLRFHASSAGLDRVDTDPRRLRQVLGNLLSNAIKYTPAGGSVFVRVGRAPPVAQPQAVAGVLIEVEDTGPGIPPDKHEAIFEEFARLPGQTARGMGLGLAISRSLTEALGGKLTLESDVDQGSTFRIRIPMKMPAAPHKAA